MADVMCFHFRKTFRKISREILVENEKKDLLDYTTTKSRQNWMNNCAVCVYTHTRTHIHM